MPAASGSSGGRLFLHIRVVMLCGVCDGSCTLCSNRSRPLSALGSIQQEPMHGGAVAVQQQCCLCLQYHVVTGPEVFMVVSAVGFCVVEGVACLGLGAGQLGMCRVAGVLVLARPGSWGTHTVCGCQCGCFCCTVCVEVSCGWRDAGDRRQQCMPPQVQGSRELCAPGLTVLGNSGCMLLVRQLWLHAASEGAGLISPCRFVAGVV